MNVSSMCEREADTARGDEPVRVAAGRMASRNVGSLVVVDERRRPIGIVTDRDLTTRVLGEGRDPERTRVVDVMTPRPETVAEDEEVVLALARMRAHGVRRLPVVGTRGAMVGIVSLDDVLANLAGAMAEVEDLLQKTSPRTLCRS